MQDQTRRPAQVVLVQDGPVPTELAEEIAGLVRESPVPVTHVEMPANVGLGRRWTPASPPPSTRSWPAWTPTT